MYPNNRTASAKLSTAEGKEVDVLVSIEYDFDVRDGRGHTRGQFYGNHWPSGIDMSEIFTLNLNTGQAYRIYVSSYTRDYTEMPEYCSIEAKFVLESHLRRHAPYEST